MNINWCTSMRWPNQLMGFSSFNLFKNHSNVQMTSVLFTSKLVCWMIKQSKWISKWKSSYGLDYGIAPTKSIWTWMKTHWENTRTWRWRWTTESNEKLSAQYRVTLSLSTFIQHSMHLRSTLFHMLQSLCD